jgi:hypothetical protein
MTKKNKKKNKVKKKKTQDTGIVAQVLPVSTTMSSSPTLAETLGDKLDSLRHSIVIDPATKEAKQYLHRTQDPANPHMHRAIVCIICDRFIIGTETIHKLTKEDIGVHSGRLGVKSYEEFYQTTLKDEVKRQYRVQGLQDMLLSPRSRKYPDGYATCSICYSAMQPQMACKKTPPKFAIANGFVIGSFPREIKFFNKNGQRLTRKVEDDEITDTLKAVSRFNVRYSSRSGSTTLEF